MLWKINGEEFFRKFYQYNITYYTFLIIINYIGTANNAWENNVQKKS